MSRDDRLCLTGAVPVSSVELRNVRVFVSSTFRDMQAERDELVLRIFPQLRAWCEARGISWVEIDLRWGITEEEARADRVLPICLTEIENCRPFFLGILGRRYGWTPQPAPTLLAEHPWLADLPGASVTELEVRFGALQLPPAGVQTFFYFRAPEAEPAGPPEPADAALRQDALKESIRESGHPLREDFRSPAQLGAWVLEDFRRALERLFPEEQAPALEEYDATAQCHWRDRLSRLCVGAPGWLAQIDAALAQCRTPVLLAGAEGSGKSTWLARWARARKENWEAIEHPAGDSPGGWIARAFGQPGGGSTHASVCVHAAVGVTAFSSQWTGLARRLALALGAARDEVEAAHGLPALLTVLGSSLRRALAAGDVALAIDGLEFLPGNELDSAVAWLTSAAQAGAGVLLTAMPGRFCDFAAARGWPIVEVPPWEAAEREEFAGKYLGAAAKKLDARLRAELTRAHGAQNPLFQRVVLDELRVFGSHEELGDRLRYYVEAPDLGALFTRVLTRFERDYEGGRPGLVAQALRLLWAARRGLGEAELCDLLGRGDGPLPAAVWSPFSVALGACVTLRGGLLALAGRSVRAAVERGYLPAIPDKRQAHAELARWFVRAPASARRFEELAWHSIATDDAAALLGLLTEPATLAALPDSMLEQWRSHALWLEARHDIRAWEHFEPGAFANHSRGALAAGNLLADLGYWRLAPAWFSLAAREAGLRRQALAGLAAAQAQAGAAEAALASFSELETEAVADGRWAFAAYAAGQQFVLSRRLARTAEAAGAARREEAHALASGSHAARAASRGHRGMDHHDAGRWREALVEFDAQTQLCRESCDLAGLREALAATALVLDRLGKWREALSLEKEVAAMGREVRDFSVVCAALGHQAALLQRAGDLDEACACLESAETLLPHVENRAVRARLLARFGELWADGSIQRYLLAEKCVADALALAEEVQEEALCQQLRARLAWLRSR